MAKKPEKTDQQKLSSIKSDSEENKKEESVIPDEILEQMPEEERGRVISIMKQTMFSGIMSRKNPIAEKITEGHIDKMIDESAKDSEREYKDKNNQRLFTLGIVFLGVLLLIFLTVYLAKSHEETLMNIIIPILAFLGGMGAGYGIAKKT